MPESNELTICSVDYQSKPFIDLNQRLTRKLNKNNNFDWVIIDNNNTPSDHPSFHHASALNKALLQIETRFGLFLDPDFYIIRKEWISDVLKHMQSNKLSFFGAPWNPRWFHKYRAFPSPNCIFIDFGRVDIKSVNFSPLPYFKNGYSKVHSGTIKYRHRRSLARTLYNISGFDSILRLKDRQLINSDNDTGYLLYKRYAHNRDHVIECLLPVFEPKTAFKNGKDYIGTIDRVGFFASRINKILETCIPENMCFIPNKRLYSKRGFRELGYFDTRSMGWEEFLWQNSPFAFHLRCRPKVLSGKNVSEESLRLKEVLSSL